MSLKEIEANITVTGDPEERLELARVIRAKAVSEFLLVPLPQVLNFTEDQLATWEATIEQYHEQQDHWFEVNMDGSSKHSAIAVNR